MKNEIFVLIVFVSSLSLVGSRRQRHSYRPQMTHGTTALARDAKDHAVYNEVQIKNLFERAKRQDELAEHRDASRWQAKQDAARAVRLAEDSVCDATENATAIATFADVISELREKQIDTGKGLEGTEKDVGELQRALEEEQTKTGYLEGKVSEAHSEIDRLKVESRQFKSVLATLVGGTEKLRELMNPSRVKAQASRVTTAQTAPLRKTYRVGDPRGVTVGAIELKQAFGSRKSKKPSPGAEKSKKKARFRWGKSNKKAGSSNS